MRRPAGVIVTCILLGFAALMLLTSAAGSLFMLAIAGNFPIPVQPGQPAPDPAMMQNIIRSTMIVSALFYAALAAWAIATLVGLIRMKSWARYSIMIIGGGVALFGVAFAIITLSLQAFMPPTLPPGQNPAVLHTILVFAALLDLVIAGIGIWWLVYFAKRSTRDAFALAANPGPALPAYIPPPSPYAASTYAVASYVEPADPAAPPIIPQAPIVSAAPIAIAAPPARPLAITIIAWLLIVPTVLCLPFAFTSFPLFFFGMELSGWTAHLTMLSWAVVSGLAGIGLLRLERVGLYAACAVYALGLLNTGFLLVPSYRERMMAYENDLIQKMLPPMPMTPAFDNHTMALMMLPGVFFAVIFCVGILALLIHYRAAFDRPTQAAAA